MEGADTSASLNPDTSISKRLLHWQDQEQGPGVEPRAPLLDSRGNGLDQKARESIEIGRRVIRIEALAVSALESRIDEKFARAVDLIFQCNGRIIITGVGKSGIIGKKIAATFSSTGTPAIFLHSAEGLHGDLGVIKQEDLVICISKSGNSQEMHLLLPLFRKIGVPVIAMTGNMQGELAKHADIVLDVSVKEEACPFDLAPTSSSTATLAMGDALAMALLARRNFSAEDFALRHPGGTLGRKLLLRIDDLMGQGDRLPRVSPDTHLDEIILEITHKRYGATCVVDENNHLLGIITDGDLRRLMSQKTNFTRLRARDIMTPKPKTIRSGVLAVKALEVMEDHNIMQVIVVDQSYKPVGMVHLHDLLKAGLA
ncbi:MAG: KpsF/GutQ family sugar-phosphate isomerase [Calditrichaeota bacterium]|nr:MAG: KpsF/GutQ family sugar-phosphate isomerase [Calditrichota bacterium]